MVEINKKSIETFYDLLGHKNQTEIRAIELKADLKTTKNIKNFFVSSKEDFVKIVQELNGKYNLYAGLNERIENGTLAKDVISVKRLFVDIDCIKKPASQEDLKEAERITDLIISDIEKQTGLKTIKIYSGNGYQLVYSIPEIEINEFNRKEVEGKIQQFLKDLIKKYSNDIVKLDNVGDLPRIIRITGTTNIKGGKVSEFIETCIEENSKLKDYILSLKPETIDSSVNKEEKIKTIMPGKEKKKDNSRSGKEMKELCKLIFKRLSKEEVFAEMDIFAKWSSALEQYKEKSYRKAIDWVESQKKKEGVNKKDSWIKYLLEQEKPEYKSLGVGLHTIEGKEILYYGTKIYNGTYGMDSIITSDRRIIVNSFNPKTEQGKNEITDIGINFRYPFLDSVLDYSWSNNSTEYSINQFLYSNKKNITLKECYEDSYKNNKEYMDYSEDITNTSISCSIISSYFLPVFEAKGRDYYNAEKGSGKTKQSTLYDLQMFNPIMSADMSGASYFRVIESTSASIVIDDFDAIEEDKKQSQIQVIRTGYKKGQKAVRCSDTGGKAPQSYSVFNSMVVNNVEGLDEITQDRCNTYYLIKSNNKNKIDKKFNEKDIKWQIQRDKKYYCALLNWELVKKTYNELEVEGVNGRDLEKIAPILTIGKLVLNEEKFKELCKFEKERISDSKTRDVSEDWLFLAIKYVVEQITYDKKNIKPIEIRLDEIVKRANRMSSEDRNYAKINHTISVFLGKRFKNTPLFKAGKIHGGYVKYKFEPLKVLKFLEINNYKEFFEDKVLDLLKQQIITEEPIQPNQSNQSILSNQPIQNKDNNNVNCGEVGEDVYVENEGEVGSEEFDKSEIEVIKI